MARDINRTNRKFLGNVINNMFAPSADEKTSHGVSSINGYCGNNIKTIDIPKLNIVTLQLAGIDTSSYSLEVGNNQYFPLSVSSTFSAYNKRGPALVSWYPREAFYIEGLRRPNVQHMASKLEQLFKEDYSGNGLYQFKLGRYVICVDNFSSTVLKTFLITAKAGDGSVIDYSWVAPIQDLIEQQVEENLKRKSNKDDVEDDYERPKKGFDIGRMKLPTPTKIPAPRSVLTRTFQDMLQNRVKKFSTADLPDRKRGNDFYSASINYMISQEERPSLKEIQSDGGLTKNAEF
jgi:hypothetical protein